MQPTKQIIIQLEEITKLVSNFNPSDKLYHEVLKKKCAELYERILLLDDLSEFEEEASMNILPVLQETSVENILVSEMQPIIMEQALSIEDIASNETVIENETEEQIALTFEETQLEVFDIEPETIKPEELAVEPISSAPHSETIDFTELSLHEKLSSFTEKQTGLSDRYSQKIDSLKSAISLNQKIAFVNLLFKENVVEYAKSIEKLNQSQNIDEALRYFTELKHSYGWDSGNELVKELQLLIEKRF
jgi:hypothetical protein